MCLCFFLCMCLCIFGSVGMLTKLAAVLCLSISEWERENFWVINNPFIVIWDHDSNSFFAWMEWCSEKMLSRFFFLHNKNFKLDVSMLLSFLFLFCFVNSEKPRRSTISLSPSHTHSFTSYLNSISKRWRRRRSRIQWCSQI